MAETLHTSFIANSGATSLGLSNNSIGVPVNLKPPVPVNLDWFR
jgi:hypothetical protein